MTSHHKINWSDQHIHHLFVNWVNNNRAHVVDSGKLKKPMGEKWSEVAKAATAELAQEVKADTAKKHWEAVRDKFFLEYNISNDTDLSQSISILEAIPNLETLDPTKSLLRDMLVESLKKKVQGKGNKDIKEKKSSSLERATDEVLHAAGGDKL